jgi:hypothetical protein
MSKELERVLAQYAGVEVLQGRSRESDVGLPEAAFVENLRAMQARQNNRFTIMVGLVAAVFALVLAFSWSNHFSMDIAKIAIGSGGVISVLSSLVLRTVWREYTIIDLVLTTLPMVAPKERQSFVLTILTSLREGRLERGDARPGTAPTV